MVVSEEQIQFHFKSSKKSNNGTDVNAGQIPQLLYRVSLSNHSFFLFSKYKNCYFLR